MCLNSYLYPAVSWNVSLIVSFHVMVTSFTYQSPHGFFNSFSFTPYLFLCLTLLCVSSHDIIQFHHSFFFTASHTHTPTIPLLCVSPDKLLYSNSSRLESFWNKWNHVYFLPMITLFNMWERNVQRITANVSCTLVSSTKIQLCLKRMWQMWKTPQDCALACSCRSVSHHHWHLPAMPQGTCREYLTRRDISMETLIDHASKCALVCSHSTCAQAVCVHIWVGECVVAWFLFVQIHLFSVLCKPTA